MTSTMLNTLIAAVVFAMFSGCAEKANSQNPPMKSLPSVGMAEVPHQPFKITRYIDKDFGIVCIVFMFDNDAYSPSVNCNRVGLAEQG